MKFATILLSLGNLVVGTPILAGNLEARQTPPRGYIVQLADGLDQNLILNLAGVPRTSVLYQYELINAFALDGSIISTVLSAFAGVLGVTVYPDVEMFTSATVTQNNAPWGLQRISSTTAISEAQRPQVSQAAYRYIYDDAKAGSGVNVYVIDTGINCGHADFGGRATCAREASFGLLNRLLGNRDGNGHGTHCAGTIGGATYGVFKKANLFAVKVLSDLGSGQTSDIIAGIEYVVKQFQATGRPTVASMSLGGGASPALDNAVAAAISRGVHFAIAAGNSNEDACTTSPARVPAAVTVGASNVTDERASFSNFGPCVDLFAPGVDTLSAWFRSNRDTNVISGTSMATPHIAGIMAYELSGGNISPATLRDRLVGRAQKGVLSSTGAGSPNVLAQL